MKILYWCDDILLWAMAWVLYVAVEWLSVSRRVFERGLILGYFAGGVVDVLVSKRSTWCLLLFVYLGRWMLRNQQSSDQQRLAQQVSGFLACWRLLMASFAFFDVVFFLTTQCDWRHAPWPLSQVCFAAFHYAVALPNGGGDPGRRRRLALEKLKELFGTSWMPMPEGA